MKTFIISHGDKGGVGKSMMANLIASMLYERGEKIGIIEADAGGGTKGSGGTPDVAPRFRNRVAKTASQPLQQSGKEASASIDRMMEMVEAWPVDYAVMNAPANASSVLGNPEVSETLAEALEAMQIDLRVTYSWAPEAPNGVENAVYAVQGAFFEAASHGVLIKNMVLGDDADYEEAIRGNKVLSEVPRVTIPKIPSDKAKVFDRFPEANLYEMGKPDGPLSTMERIRIQKFYRTSRDNLAAALGLTGVGDNDGKE